MTDEAYVFNSTVSERSSLKKAAQHKKNGPAVAKLGNKRMTAQEIQERHGECKEYNLDGFMSFNEFKVMPKDIQVEYVNKLQEKYDIGLVQISRYLFNEGDEALQSHLRINGILNQCNPNKRRAKVGLVQFQKDIDDYFKEKKRRAEEIEQKKRAMLGQFISYEEYCELTFEDKIDYVNSLIVKYGVSINAISVFLFGLKQDTLGSYFYFKNARGRIKNLEDRSRNVISEKRKAFKEAVDEWRGYPKEEQVIEKVKSDVVGATTPEVPAREVDEEKKVQESVNKMTFKYEFVGDGNDLNRFRSLGEMFEGKKVRVSIEITEV